MDQEIVDILTTYRIIAVVGCSPKPDRPGHWVPAYMKDRGYTIIPVNPGHTEILGERCYKSLLDIPGQIDVVTIFRRAEDVPPIVDQAIEKRAKVVWMQSGIIHEAAAAKARSAGLTVIMDRCMYQEHLKVAS